MKGMVILSIAVLLGGGIVLGEEELPNLDKLLSDLDELKCVSGKSVGFPGTEGRFYEISRQLAELAVEGLPERLLGSSLPIRRSMGLVLLVERDGKKAVPVLRARIDDRSPVDENAYGCVISQSSVGAIARGLLGNRNWLGDYVPWEPLLLEADLIALDVGILGRDDTALVHELVGGDVLDALDEGKLPLDLDALRKRFPDLPQVRLVKALGRLRSMEYNGESQGDLRRWVRALAADRERPVPVRLAAASALAHWELDEFWTPRPFPAAGLTDLPGVALAVVRRDYQAVRDLEEHQGESGAFAAGHIVALPEILFSLPSSWESDPDPERKLPEGHAEALLRMSERLDEWQAEWNVFGDGLYDLESAIAADR